MPSLFARAAAVAGATVDRVYSEGFTLEPRALPSTAGVVDVNARPVVSAARTVIAFVGTFVAAGSVTHAKGRTMADATTHGIVAERPMIDIAVTALPGGALQGDVVRRDSTGETFTVTRFVAEDLGRAWVHLAELRSTEALPR